MAVPAPEQDEDKSNKHSAKVGKMGYAIIGAHNAGDKLDDSVSNDKPFGFDWQ
jgi:hypothetical protein